MNILFKNHAYSFYKSGRIAFMAILFFLFIFSSNVFAQADKESTESKEELTQAEKALLSRQYTDMLRSVFTFLEQNYVDEIDSTKMYEAAMSAIMDSVGDPYTAYLDEPSMRSLNDTTVGNFGGVGLSISKLNVSTPENPAYVEVASPIEDTPGWKAGIQAGDLIISINGVSTPDISMEEVLGMLRGKVGEPVDLRIRRGKNMEFDVTLIRAIIEVPTVKYQMMDNDLGYLRIIEFTPQTAERVQQALDNFAAASYKGLIIDLRNNPGGLITSVVEVADKFIEEGVIVSTKSRIASENRAFYAKKANTTVPKNLPIVVLINQGSASASEILAGALKDYHLAYLVGENTYGKGSVQQVIPLNLNNDGIKLTTARYYTPSDANIDKVGIPPDREILLPVFNEEEEKAYLALLESKEVEAYVEKHKNMSDYEIAEYAKTLKKKYDLELRVLRKVIWLEVYKTKNQPLYDLDYDLQLQAAVDILKNESFSSLIKKTKTIHQLQDDAAKNEAKEAKEKK